MNSPNIRHLPINRDGCLELRISPCTICNLGYTCYSNKENKTCYDNCKYFKKYCENIKDKNV